MDLESQETLTAAIKAAELSLKAVLDDAFVKVEAIIRDGIAEMAGALVGWELQVSPITIKLTRNVK